MSVVETDAETDDCWRWVKLLTEYVANGVKRLRRLWVDGAYPAVLSGCHVCLRLGYAHEAVQGCTGGSRLGFFSLHRLDKPSCGIITVVCWSVVTFMGCTHPLGPRVTWREVGDAVVNAATSPMVLGPAAGAVAFHIDDWDEQVAAWATDHTPLFGSPGEAEEASDLLRDVSQWAFGIAAVATPTGPEGTYVLANKVWEVGLGAATIESTRLMTNAFKDVSREHLNKRSFPSAHAARAAVGSTLAVRYVDYYAVPGWARSALKGALITLPYATGWARLEAGVHVPSDVLAGVAWGNFFGVLVNGLLDARTPGPVSVTVLPVEKGAMVCVGIRY